MLSAYLDASGTDPSQRVIAVAGFAATKDKWHSFCESWRPLMKELGLSHWHNTDFHNKRCEYHDWSDVDPRRLYAPRQISDIINAVEPFGIGAAIFKKDWEDLQFVGKIAPEDTPIRFCLDHCLEALIHRLHQFPEDDGIGIFIDRDENENLAREITDWHVDYYRNNSENINPQRDITLAFGSDKKFLPIQIADILSNETYRYMHNKDVAPFLGAETIAGIVPNSPSIIESVKKKSWLNVQCLNKGGLEIVYSAKRDGSMRPDGRYFSEEGN